MTRSALKTLIASWVDDTAYGYFSETFLNTLLNNAQKYVQQLLIMAGKNQYVICVTTPIFTDQKEYVLPDDFLSVRRVQLITSGFGTTNPIKTNLDDFTMRQDSILFPYKGTPEGYFTRRNRLALTPTPSTSNQWYIEMEYNYLVADMDDDTDEPDVPEEYMELVALVAAYDCFIKDDRVPSTLEKKLRRYEEEFAEFATTRMSTGPRRVIETGW